MRLPKSLRPRSSKSRALFRLGKAERPSVVLVRGRSKRSSSDAVSKTVFLRRVVGRSMLPTLRHGQVVVCWRSARVRVGDVVIVVHNGVEKIKRAKEVRTHHIFITGDNPGESTDSRHFGWLTHDQVVGCVIWPKK